MDEAARGSADQPADRRISGSAQRISASADQSLLDQRSPRIAEPADLQISGSLGGSADQSLDESAEPADQRISGSLSGSADQRMGSRSPRINGSADHSADQPRRRIRESQRQCRLDRKSFPKRTCPIYRRVIRTRQPGFFFFFFALASGTWCRRGQGLPSELSTLHAPLPNFAFTAIIAEHLFASHLLSLAPFSQPTQIIL